MFDLIRGVRRVAIHRPCLAGSVPGPGRDRSAGRHGRGARPAHHRDRARRRAGRGHRPQRADRGPVRRGGVQI
ncbi:MAG: hypothetical protein EON90_04045 [Brevundimonas sp.]|nr:MAG: hypothetical protein EON90_04045 [Brevundimonas sp.]